MARPSTITEQQILEAARNTFLEKGIRATTAEVARRARVAEGSIFSRFPTKHDLFCAAMQLEVGEPAWFGSLQARAGRGSVKTNMIGIGMEILEFFRSLMPLMMMSWSNPLPSGFPPALGGRHPVPVRGLKKVTQFFAVEMRTGRMKRRDPEVVARLFLGSLVHYVFLELLLKSQRRRMLPARAFVRGMVATLWQGLDPKSTRKKE